MITEREIFMALVDGDQVRPADAIVLLEGDGLNRYQHAVELYKEQMAPLLVFSGGITDYDYGSFPYEEVKPFLLKEGIPPHCLYHENVSLHTKQQGDEIMNLCRGNGWDSIILVASHYHQYRAYLTFLKSMFDSGLKLLIYNSPVRNLKWFSDERWGNRFTLLQNEFERIKKYRQAGHLATYEEAIEYQKWKEQH